MNEAIFEADHLHGEPQPAKPMTGDRPGDKPVYARTVYARCVYGTAAIKESNPAAVPEQGEEFDRAVFKIIYENDELPVASEIVMMLAAAHNRDMSALTGELNVSRLANESLRKRISTLEAENARLRADKAELVEHMEEMMGSFFLLSGEDWREFGADEYRKAAELIGRKTQGEKMNIFEVIERERPKYQTVLECRYITKETFDAALDRISEAAKELQSQVPKTVKPTTTMKTTINNVTRLGDDHFFAWYNCPLCNRSVCKEDIFCNCGVRIDWSKEDA